MTETTDEKQVSQMALTLVEKSKVMRITDDASYELAGSLLVAIKDGIKQIKAWWEEPVKRARAALEILNERKNGMLDPVIGAEATIKVLIGDYRIKKERERQEAERVARLALEVKAQQDKAELVKEMKEFGDDTGAQALASAPVIVPPVILAGAPKISGVRFRDNWKAEVVNAALIPREYLIVDEAKLGKIARELKADAVVPGVRFYAEKTVIAGG